MNGERRAAYRILVGKSKRKEQSRKLLCGKILKLIKKSEIGDMEWINLAQDAK